MSIMGALFADFISIVILFKVCCAKSLPLYGVNFAVLYNHSSGTCPLVVAIFQCAVVRIACKGVLWLNSYSDFTSCNDYVIYRTGVD